MSDDWKARESYRGYDKITITETTANGEREYILKPMPNNTHPVYEERVLAERKGEISWPIGPTKKEPERDYVKNLQAEVNAVCRGIAERMSRMQQSKLIGADSANLEQGEKAPPFKTIPVDPKRAPLPIEATNGGYLVRKLIPAVNTPSFNHEGLHTFMTGAALIDYLCLSTAYRNYGNLKDPICPQCWKGKLLVPVSGESLDRVCETCEFKIEISE